MTTKQLAVIVIAITAIGAMYFLGSTTFPKQSIAKQQQNSIGYSSLLADAEPKLDASQKDHHKHLLEELKNSNSDSTKIKIYGELITFWGRDVQNDELAIYYVGEKAKLENSEKNLTFAADLILENCIMNNSDFLKRSFKANIAKDLYEKAIAKNPTNDSLKIGLGGCYMFGAGGDNPMEGISKVLGVLQKDSTNAYAHKILGYGNLQNGQTDKAIDRFIKSYNYNNADVGLVPYIALLSKKLGKMELSKQWEQKAKEVLAKEPKLLEEFEKEYQSSK